MASERKQPIVLIADDEEVICELLRRRLSTEGYDVRTASDGEEAVSIFSREFVNAIVTDVRMPGLDGIEVLRRAKALNADTEVIVMTAYASTDSAIEAVRQGAFDYIQKPFEHVDDVVHKIRCALKQQQLTIQNREIMRKLEEMNRGLKQVVLSRTRELIEAHERLKRANKSLKLAIEQRNRAMGDLPTRIRSGLETVCRLASELDSEASQHARDVAEKIRREAAALADLVAEVALPIPLPEADAADEPEAAD